MKKSRNEIFCKKNTHTHKQNACKSKPCVTINNTTLIQFATIEWKPYSNGKHTKASNYFIQTNEKKMSYIIYLKKKLYE